MASFPRYDYARLAATIIISLLVCCGENVGLFCRIPAGGGAEGVEAAERQRSAERPSSRSRRVDRQTGPTFLSEHTRKTYNFFSENQPLSILRRHEVEFLLFRSWVFKFHLLRLVIPEFQ